MVEVMEDFKSWADKYKIRIKKGNCPVCKIEITTTIPFAIKGYRGLKSKDHGCGEKFTRKVMVPVDKSEKEFWSRIL